MNWVPCHTISWHCSQKGLHPMFAAHSSLRTDMSIRGVWIHWVKWHQPLVLKENFLNFGDTFFWPLVLDFFRKRWTTTTTISFPPSICATTACGLWVSTHLHCLTKIQKEGWWKYVKCWLIMYLLCIYVDINILQIYRFFLTSILYLSYCLLFVVFYTYCPLGTIVQWKKSLGPYAICKVLQIPNENNCKLFVSWGRCTLTQHPKAFKNLPGYEK